MAHLDSLDSAFNYIESFTNLERQHKPRSYRLERMKFLLDEFGHPETGLKFIHVAGSKGKGSTATFIASVLEHAGIATGLYTSPHVVSYRERVTRAGTQFSDQLYLDLIREIKTGVDEIEKKYRDIERLPTTFELLTLLGFMAFRRTGCSWAVIETGIGGRLDATNIIRSEASVITPIELEHTDILGSTIEQIAGEKAGIIKAGKPVFVGAQLSQAFNVLKERAGELGSECVPLTDCVQSFAAETTLTGTRFSVEFAGGASYRATLRLIGAMQAENASLAALVVHSLFPEIDSRTIEEGLADTFLPGRMEIVQSNPPVLLDGAHTAASIRKVLSTFGELHPHQQGVLVFGAVDGKNFKAMAELLGPAFPEIIVTTPGFFKQSHPGDVHEAIRQYNPAADLILDPGDAIREAIRRSTLHSPSLPVLVTGSFYLVADIRARLSSPAAQEVTNEVAS